MDSEKYNIDKNDILGEGSYGTVFRGSTKSSQTTVAVKQIKNADYLHKSTVQEIKSLKSIKHDNIVELFDVYEDLNWYWIVLEFCDLGDLQAYLEHNEPLLAEKVNIMVQCASAISYMHNQKPCIVHRDIKLNNILLKTSGIGVTVKVCDFGLSKLLDNANQQMMTDTGTPAFRAPELFQKKDGRLHYNASVDTFALGLVFKIMLDFPCETKKLELHEGINYISPNFMYT